MYTYGYYKSLFRPWVQNSMELSSARPEQMIVRMFFVLFLLLPPAAAGAATYGKQKVDNIDVGVILDLNSTFGIVSNCCIAMALHDIHAATISGQTPRFTLHVRDSGSSDMGAISAVFDLLKNGVQAIVGAQLATHQTELLRYMSSQARVPIMSLSTSWPLHSSSRSSSTAYLVDTDARDNSQVKAITALVKAYKWKEVIIIHDDTQWGTSLLPYLTLDLHEAGMKYVYQRVLTSSATYDQIDGTLRELDTMKMRVFLVHTSISLAVALFRRVHELGMMSEGYVWIITSRIANLLNYMDPAAVETMQGVLGLRNSILKSTRLNDFELRWKRKMKREQPEVDVSELDVYALWAYDAMLFVAKAAQKEDFLRNRSFPSSTSLYTKLGPEPNNLFDLVESSIGQLLLESMLSTQLKGLSGEVVRVVEGQFALSDVFEIVNIAGKVQRRIGYWTHDFGLCRNLSSVKNYSTDAKNLAGVVWPGGVVLSPRRRMTETKLKVGVPIKDGYYEYVKVVNGMPSGFSIDVFKYVMNTLSIDFDWEAYPKGDEDNYYDRLIQQVVEKTYDVVVGDITITAQRSIKVDFSQPYADSDVAMIVQLKDENDTNNPMWFLKPVSPQLWGATIAILILKGVLLWFFESKINKEFNGTVAYQLRKILSLSFTTNYIFSDQDKLRSNYSRFILGLWTIIGFILITGYTANLTSMLTVQSLHPKIRDLQTLINNNEWIGYQDGSFVEEYLKCRGAKRLRPFSTDVQYSEALSNGSIAAIVDEMPYIRVFLARHPEFGIVDRINHTGGLGFVFPKGSTLVSCFSEGLLKLGESEEMCQIERKWFGNDTCSTAKQDASVSNSQLTLSSFVWLYMFTICASALTLFAFLVFSSGGQGTRIEPAEDSDPANPRDQLPDQPTVASQLTAGSLTGQGRQEVPLRRLESGQGSSYDTARESDDIMGKASTSRKCFLCSTMTMSRS